MHNCLQIWSLLNKKALVLYKLNKFLRKLFYNSKLFLILQNIIVLIPSTASQIYIFIMKYTN